jgi:hypothetical protein
MRTVSILLVFISLSCYAIGQVTEGEAKLRKFETDSVGGWKKGAVIGINLNQASLTNWAAGGQNSFGVNGLTSIFANYKKDRMSWDNSLDVGYGLLRQGPNADFIKTD